MRQAKQPNIAVKRAIEKASKTDNYQPVYQPLSVNLTEAQKQKMDELLTLLEVSKRFILNLAIRYASIYADKKKLPVEKLIGFPKTFGNLPIDVELTAGTNKLLSEKHLDDKSKGLVVLGLKLLHAKLLNI